MSESFESQSDPLTQTAKPAQGKIPSGARRFLSSALLSAGIILCVVGATLAVAAFGGYIAGKNEAGVRGTATTVVEVDTQFGLGMQDLQNGNYELAAQRFRYVLSIFPQYPGALEALAQAEAQLGLSGTPQATLAPASGNPDEMFVEAQRLFDTQDWVNAIQRLQQLQRLDPAYRTDEVNAMLYESLVTLGLQYVRGDRMEEGLILLDQAARIKPLDDQAAGEKHLAELYLTGKRYAGLNWAVAINNFQAIYDTAPNYRDVKARLLEAYLRRAEELTALGGHCDAAMLYQLAQEIKNDATIVPTLDVVSTQCAIPTLTPISTSIPGSTGTPSLIVTPGGVPTATATTPP